MKHLLDVNIPVAWGWRYHADHDRVVRWIANPSSALKKQPLLICSGLSNKSAVFLHYILHHLRSAWEAQAQVREQHGDVLIGLCHRP